MQRPQKGEYRDFFQRYIDLVPGGNYMELLRSNTIAMQQFFMQIPVHLHDYAYAQGKWTIKQVLMHLADTERGMSYRAFTALRGDNQSLLPMLDENLFAEMADVSGRTLADILEEFVAIRTATEKLFAHVTEEDSMRTANVTGIHTTARAKGYIMIGHVLHHIQVIKERYLL